LAQLQWNVPSIGGRAYRVGLYHGEGSGHLLLYVNNKITLIDFGVQDSKDYSFFLEEELFELKITKTGTSYNYALVHNEELDTPFNKQRRSQQRFNRLSQWVGGVLLLLLLSLVVVVVRKSSSQQEQAITQLAAGKGIATSGRVHKVDQRWYIQFVADHAAVRELLPATDTIHPLGFPLEDGDDLPLRYQPEDPSIVRIQWTALSPTQLQRYGERTLRRHLALNPGLSPRQAACQLAIAYEDRGLAGWALFYHQDGAYNDSLNRSSYLRYIRDPEVAERLRNCL